MIFSRDPVTVIGNNVIEASLRFPFRRKERYSIRPILDSHLKNSNANYVAIPPASPHINGIGPFLEGGDVLLNGYEVYVGHTGNASNKGGTEWLQDHLCPKYKVYSIRLSPEFVHLDCVLSLIRPGLGVIYRKGFIDELPGSLKRWDFVEVTEDEARRLGANVFVIDEKTVIVDKQHHRIAQELRKRGVGVIELPYAEVSTFGGAFRRSHHPLQRESRLE